MNSLINPAHREYFEVHGEELRQSRLSDVDKLARQSVKGTNTAHNRLDENDAEIEALRAKVKDLEGEVELQKERINKIGKWLGDKFPELKG